MKRAISFILLLVMLSFTGISRAEDWKAIYEELKPVDFEYIFGIDPWQTEDYTKYVMSPYPLLRTSVPFRFKDTVIPPGYYLLTPREQNGKDYVLFKESGRVKYIVPAYDTRLVPALFYEQHVPTRKKTWWEGVCEKTSNFIGRTFKKSMRTEPPKSYIDVNDRDNTYWEVILYYGLKSYHILFEKEGQ